ncbi:MAG: YqiA/YcfP family alpha/beta fold hydrolase [Cyclonatronaceae bacterium]
MTGVAYDSFASHDQVNQSLRSQIEELLDRTGGRQPLSGKGTETGAFPPQNVYPPQTSRKQKTEAVPAPAGGQRDVVLAGTSLGGYWAARFGNLLNLPAVLINPTIHPYQSLRRYTGHRLHNFVTRTRNTLRESVPKSYHDIERSGDFLVLLDKGDEVLDYQTALAWYEPHLPADRIIVFEGGSHRFGHMEEALPHIRQFLFQHPVSR